MLPKEEQKLTRCYINNTIFKLIGRPITSIHHDPLKKECEKENTPFVPYSL